MDFTTLAAAAVKRSFREALFLHWRVGLPRPTSVRAMLTERCNYKCLYCWHWRQESYTPEMTVEEWKGILDQIRDYAGPFPIQFLGGEPMIWPGFIELVEYCRSRKIRWGTITNGSVLNPRLVKAAVASRPTNIDVSVDASIAAVHDQARGVRGSFAHIEAGLMRLLEERAAAGARFPIRIKTTVHKLNANCLLELVDWVAKLPDVTVDFSPVRLSAVKDRDQLYLCGETELRELDAVLEKLIERKESGAPIESSPERLRGLGAHFRGDGHVFHGYGECRAGLRTLDIRPDGSVNHCAKFPIGNLRTHSLREIWEHPTRRRIIESTLSCEHAGGNMCGMSCTSYRTGRQELRRALLFLKSRPSAAQAEVHRQALQPNFAAAKLRQPPLSLR
jgi:radical SAM protein with 4Fe4S-binding SPASM domain